MFSRDLEKEYKDFSLDAVKLKDDKLRISFDSEEVRTTTLSLLKFNCPATDCQEVLSGWKDLKKHVESAHERVMCDVCTRHKKVFTQEHFIYTQAQLRKHENDGDKNGSQGHPRCQFCRTRFYSDDELFLHCR